MILLMNSEKTFSHDTVRRTVKKIQGNIPTEIILCRIGYMSNQEADTPQGLHYAYAEIFSTDADSLHSIFNDNWKYITTVRHARGVVTHTRQDSLRDNQAANWVYGTVLNVKNYIDSLNRGTK